MRNVAALDKGVQITPLLRVGEFGAVVQAALVDGQHQGVVRGASEGHAGVVDEQANVVVRAAIKCPWRNALGKVAEVIFVAEHRSVAFDGHVVLRPYFYGTHFDVVAVAGAQFVFCVIVLIHCLRF